MLKGISTLICLSIGLICTPALSSNTSMTTHQIFDEARKNTNWKLAFATGPHAQVVLMNITPDTNPNNEVGTEVHQFDQVVFVIEGEGQAILNKKVSEIKRGDMIFISQGTPYNIINSKAEEPLKIVSVYSRTELPAHAIYRRKSDERKG